MSKTNLIPTFAVVGHPNEGKTTVIATLAEEDAAEISPEPGTTTKCHDFPVNIDGEEVLRFVDTPGFEQPLQALEWFKAHEHDGSLAEKFLAAHSGPAFSREREIMKPLAAGAAVIYVVDGSRRVRQADRVEMEILRLINQPRIAVINAKRGDGAYVDAWREALRKTFNSVREFDAHHATFRDRLDLLRGIRGMIQEWEPALDATIAAFEDDWAGRIRKSADGICELLRGALGCVEREEIGEDASKEKAGRRAEEKLRESIRAEEDRFRKRIRGFFRHRRVRGPEQGSLLVEDLFSESVKRSGGLPRQALAAASAGIGAIIGGVIDAHLLGASFMTGTVIGFVAGGTAGWLGANALTAVDFELPGGVRVKPFRAADHAVARPRAQSQLPWLLLDRALEFFHWASTWSHGRRGVPASSTDSAHPWRTAQWTKQQRDVAQNFVALASIAGNGTMLARLGEVFRRRKKDPETVEREMRDLLVGVIEKMTGCKR